MSISIYEETEQKEREADDTNVCHIKDRDGHALCFSTGAGIPESELKNIGWAGNAPFCVCGEKRCPKCAAIWLALQGAHF